MQTVSWYERLWAPVANVYDHTAQCGILPYMHYHRNLVLAEQFYQETPAGFSLGAALAGGSWRAFRGGLPGFALQTFLRRAAGRHLAPVNTVTRRRLHRQPIDARRRGLFSQCLIVDSRGFQLAYKNLRWKRRSSPAQRAQRLSPKSLGKSGGQTGGGRSGR